jgi:hypothetical protein
VLEGRRDVAIEDEQQPDYLPQDRELFLEASDVDAKLKRVKVSSRNGGHITRNSAWDQCATRRRV